MVLDIDLLYSSITMLLSLLFLLSVIEQYTRKHRPHQLAWAIALSMFIITSGAQIISAFYGYWDPLIYQVYYLLAAFQVLVMGVGVLYLMSSRELINQRNNILAVIIFFGIYTMFSFFFQFINPLLWLVLIPSLAIIVIYIIAYVFSYKVSRTPFTHIFVLFSLYSFILMIYSAIISQLNYPLLASTGSSIGGQGWLNTDAVVRLFAALFNIDGSVALIFGALYSYIVWQISIRRKQGHFALQTGLFNVYIAIGALVFAAGGTVSALGISAILYITEVVGIILMYFGYLESDTITLHKIADVLTLGWLRHPSVSDNIEVVH